MFIEFSVLGAIGHFRIVFCLFLKARPRAKPFIWKWVLSACEWKLTKTRFEKEVQGNSEMPIQKEDEAVNHKIG